MRVNVASIDWDTLLPQPNSGSSDFLLYTMYIMLSYVGCRRKVRHA